MAIETRPELPAPEQGATQLRSVLLVLAIGAVLALGVLLLATRLGDALG